MPERSRNWRRVKMMSSADGECSRMYFSVGRTGVLMMNFWVLFLEWTVSAEG